MIFRCLASKGKTMALAVILSIGFAVTTIYLAWRLVSERRAWQPERAQLQFKIDLAKRLLERDPARSRDIGWQMWSGTPEQQKGLASFLDHQDALGEAKAENVDPLPPS